MVNLQGQADPKDSQLQQRLLLGVPIAVGALLAALILGFGVVRSWRELQANTERLDRLEELKARIPMLRAQIASTAESQLKAERQQRQVLQLIEGSGDLSAFLAQVDREASRFGVQLDLYEPVLAAPAPAADAKPKDAAPKNPDAPPAAPASPLEAAGLTSQRVLLRARGPYPSLLAFLRSMEKLALLVTQTNLALTVVDSSRGNAQASPPPGGAAGAALPVVVPKTELKLMLTSYRMSEPPSARAAAPKP